MSLVLFFEHLLDGLFRRVLFQVFIELLELAQPRQYVEENPNGQIHDYWLEVHSLRARRLVPDDPVAHDILEEWQHISLRILNNQDAMIIQKQKRYNRIKIVILREEGQIHSLFLQACQGEVDVGRIVMEAKEMQIILEGLASHVLSLLIHT